MKYGGFPKKFTSKCILSGTIFNLQKKTCKIIKFIETLHYIFVDFQRNKTLKFIFLRIKVF